MRRSLLPYHKLVQQNISEILNSNSALKALEERLDQKYVDQTKWKKSANSQ
jgi:hypothetical protein